MPKITVHKESDCIAEYFFKDNLSIGRHKTNDIVLDEHDISKIHLYLIQTVEGEYVLYDNASLNGTYVGHQRIHYYRLSHGTTFRIGEYKLTFTMVSGKDARPKRLRTSNKIDVGNSRQTDAKTILSAIPRIIDDRESCRDPSKRMALILWLGKEIVTGTDPNLIAEKAMDILMKIMEAQRGFLALRNEAGELVYLELRGFQSEGRNIRVSRTMIKDVVENGLSILTADAVSENHYQKAKSVISYQLKSVICVPLQVADEVLGCIYLDDSERTERFTPEDLDFLTILAHQIAISIKNSQLIGQITTEKEALLSRLRFQEKIVFISPKMDRLYEQINKVAPSNVSVLIRGETGCGKELVAKAIHKCSGRTGRFIAINCAAIPDKLLESELFGFEKGAFTDANSTKIGQLEAADGGTILLDEIGEMSPRLQAKLLRVLEDGRIMRIGSSRSKKINARILAATHQDLEEMIKCKTFRQDLYFRLNGVELSVPALKERREDILVLANYMLLKFARNEKRRLPVISRKAMQILHAYDWPGNVRELRNVLEGATLLGDGVTIKPGDLPDRMSDASVPSRFPPLEEVEKEHILRALTHTKGNKSKASELLGITRGTLYEKLARYGIQAR
ncbi:MAG: sigma 54-interacting transcriptional regulator [Desulfobacteraceae bacterium]